MKVKVVMQKEQRSLKQLYRAVLMTMKMILTKLIEEIAHLRLQLKNWQMMLKRRRRSLTSNYAKVFVTSLNTTKICNTST